MVKERSRIELGVVSNFGKCPSDEVDVNELPVHHAKKFGQEAMNGDVGYGGTPKNRALREQVSYDLSALSAKHRTRFG